jgi:hypothetical protein
MCNTNVTIIIIITWINSSLLQYRLCLHYITSVVTITTHGTLRQHVSPCLQRHIMYYINGYFLRGLFIDEFTIETIKRVEAFFKGPYYTTLHIEPSETYTLLHPQVLKGPHYTVYTSWSQRHALYCTHKSSRARTTLCLHIEVSETCTVLHPHVLKGPHYTTSTHRILQRHTLYNTHKTSRAHATLRALPSESYTVLYPQVLKGSHLTMFTHWALLLDIYIALQPIRLELLTTNNKSKIRRWKE